VSSTEFHRNSLPQNQPSRSVPGDNAAFQHTQPEHFVDATVASEFLSITRKYLLKLSRLGIVPAHPLGIGSRRQWRYRISELAQWALALSPTLPDNGVGSPRAAKRGK
jgi:hypothetical protein